MAIMLLNATECSGCYLGIDPPALLSVLKEVLRAGGLLRQGTL